MSLLKWEKGGLKSSTARARGLGSARDGVHHWFMQRVTSIANLPLVIWFVWSLMGLVGADHTTFTAWLAQPLNSILMILLTISIFYHAQLGTQVVTEDYVHNEGLKVVKLIVQKLFFFGLAIACIFSILKISFGA